MVIGHPFLVPTMAANPLAVVPVLNDPVRRSIDDVFDFNKIAAVFYDVVLDQHAACRWGQHLDRGVLWMITAFAAPCIVSAEMYMARYQLGGMQSDQLLIGFEPDFRRYQWWWGNLQDKDALVDMVALDSRPRIFAGCMATWDYDMDENPQSSQVYKHDDDGIATWYVFVLELRGDHDVYIDLMVHADATMMDILLFACKLFHMPLTPSTVLILWGLDEHGAVDVDDPTASLGLTTDSTSPMMHRSFAEVFEIMQQVAVGMEENLLEEETEDFEHHYEWRHIVKVQATLWD